VSIPAYLPKSHLPEKAREQANWYKRIRCLSFLMFSETTRQHSTKQIQGFILMASKADKDFYRYVFRRKGGIFQYLMESKRAPNAKTS
jgi:hypothetical protein